MVPDIEVANSQPAAVTLDAILARFEDRILEILTTCLNPIIMALDAHTVRLDAQAVRLDAQQEIFDHLATQPNDRNSSSSSEDLADPTPPVEMPATSFGSSNPFADDLAHHLAPLQHQTIHNYMPGGGGLNGRGPPGGGGLAVMSAG